MFFLPESPYSLDNGYLSDGDAAFRSNGGQHEDGYLSEGGASFYARKIQSRIAIEKQRTQEEQRRKFSEPASSSSSRPLPRLPDVLGKESDSGSKEDGGGESMADNGIYR